MPDPILIADHPALDLLNTVANVDGKPLDFWQSDEDVTQWLAQAGVTQPDEAPSYPPLALPTTPLRPDTRSDWNQNPYNVALGGPVGQPALFFSNETARNLFKRRLRYVMARWGYSPAVFSWEVIDQLDKNNLISYLSDLKLYLK